MAQRIGRDEFQRRSETIRSLMRQQRLDCLVIYSQRRGHVPYVSGYRPNYVANSAVVLFPLDDKPVLWIKFGFDRERARMESWFEEIRCCAGTVPMIMNAVEAIRSLGLDTARIGLVAGDPTVDEMSVSFRDHLTAQLPLARFDVASDLLNGLRVIKSEREVESMREAARLADRVAECFGKCIKPGEKDYVASAAAEHVARREGADNCLIFVSTDPRHMAAIPSGFEFREKSLVNCEISVQLHQYWVQICRVYCLGKPSSEQLQVFRACRAAYEAATSAARSGTPVAAIAQAAHEVVVGAGYEDHNYYSAGHGVGLDLPELYPIEQGCTVPLPRNAVLVIHPNIWAPPSAAAFVGGPVVVGESGASALDSSQREIFEV